MPNMPLVRFAVAAGTALAIVAGTALPSAAAPGHLDTTFSRDGQVATKVPGGPSYVHALAVQKDGKIVAGGTVELSGTNTAWVIVRYKPGGGVDRSFGSNGHVTTDFSGGIDELQGIAVMSDGRIVAGGYTPTMFAAARYLSSGKLDKTFSGDGKALVNIGPDFDGAYALALAPGGKVVLGGESDNNAGDDSFAVVRLTASGHPDPTFDGDGRAVTDFGTNAYGDDLFVGGDGSILLSGDVNGPSYSEVGIVSYMPNGTLVDGFGNHGIVLQDMGKAMYPRGIVKLSSGKVVVAGPVQGAGSDYDAGIVRFTASGDPDPSFGPVGLVTNDFPKSNYVEGLRRAGSKYVLAVGLIDNAAPQKSRMCVARLVANGAADTSFGDQGVGCSTLVRAYSDAVVVQSNGRIVVGGNNVYALVERIALARFLAK